MKQAIATWIVGALAVHAASASPILEQGFEDAAFVADASLAVTAAGDGAVVGGVWGNSSVNPTTSWSPHVAEKDNDLITGGTKSLRLSRSDVDNWRTGVWYGRRTDAGLTDDFTLTFYLNPEAFYTGAIQVATRAGAAGEHIGLYIGATSTTIYGDSTTTTLLQDHPNTWHGFRFVGNVAGGTYDVYQMDGSEAVPVWQKVNTTPITFNNTVLTEVSGLVGFTFSGNPDAFLDDASLVIPEPASATLLGLLTLVALHPSRARARHLA